MMSDKQNTALIMAGGTGGHIFPGMAVAKELVERNWQVSWLGSKGGMEEKLVAENKIELNLISVSGLRGNGILGWLKAPFSLTRAVYESVKVLKKKAPTVVIGFGGFASGPGGLAAFITRTPLIIHEQNAIAGLTNRVLSRLAKMTFQAFPGAFTKQNRRLKTVGNPVRKDILALNASENNKVEAEPLKILVIGGSRGALALNKYLPAVFAELGKDKVIEVRHQVGKARLAQSEEFYQSSGFKNIYLSEFINDMSEAFSWADLVICRAGASTVSEVAAAGICAVFIPYPYAVDDHQTANAQWLVKQNAALCFSEEKIKTQDFIREIKKLISSSSKMNQMREKAKAMAYLNAANEVANYCEEISAGKLRKKAA